MKTEVRFLLAMLLMLGVLVGTNFLFPPVPPEQAPVPDTTTVPVGDRADTADPVIPDAGGVQTGEVTEAPSVPEQTQAEPSGQTATPETTSAPGREVTVEGPLYRYVFSTQGARLLAAEMTQFQSFRRDGVVDLLPAGAPGYLGQKVVVGEDTVDLSRVRFETIPEDGLRLEADGAGDTLRFVYQHPTQPFRFEMAYIFEPDLYAVTVRGRMTGLNRALLVTRLGEGLAYAEADSAQETRSMAYVASHVSDGIDSWNMDESEARVVEGPLHWAAFRSKFFVLALLAQEEEGEAVEGDYLGGMLVAPGELEERTEVQVTQSVAADGSFAYRLFMGPQEYARLSSLGDDMEEVNPYGYRFIRPIVRPFVSIIITVLAFLHDNLEIGYGWVLIIFGVLMRVIFFPLYHKSMKAQLKNMAVQPLVKRIQAEHKDNPEKLQKEMMKLYKDHGFNPVAGCLPMLLPFPVLIALFFVFQNAIEFRGVEFLWLPDLSAADPLYVLPVILALSMFLMQFVSYKSLDEPNPQMKMMMWIMPGVMLFIFMNLPSGLNLYYATANIATLPQSIWIARERKKVKPITLSDD